MTRKLMVGGLAAMSMRIAEQEGHWELASQDPHTYYRGLNN